VQPVLSGALAKSVADTAEDFAGKSREDVADGAEDVVAGVEDAADGVEDVAGRESLASTLDLFSTRSSNMCRRASFLA